MEWNIKKMMQIRNNFQRMTNNIIKKDDMDIDAEKLKIVWEKEDKAS